MTTPEMSTIETVGWVALAVVGLCGSALCSGMETGFYALNRVRLAVRAGDPANRRARALRAEVDQPDRVLATLLISNNLFNYFGVLGLTALLTARGFSETALVVFNALLVTPVLLVLGESLPKEVFRTTADRIMPAVLPVLRLLRWTFTACGGLPLVLFFGRVASGLTGGDREAAFGRDRRSRIAALLKEGAGQGMLSASQSTLLDRALDLRNAVVAGEMTPWRQVATLRAGETRASAMRLFARGGHGRMPIVGPDGTVRGILRQIDLHLEPDKTPAALAVKPLLLEPDMPVGDAIRAMSVAGVRVAVIARRGKPIGLVTTADLLTPLTGKLPF